MGQRVPLSRVRDLCHFVHLGLHRLVARTTPQQAGLVNCSYLYRLRDNVAENDTKTHQRPPAGEIHTKGKVRGDADALDGAYLRKQAHQQQPEAGYAHRQLDRNLLRTWVRNSS